MIAVAAVALVAGVGGAALATSSSASSATDTAAKPTPTPSAGNSSPGSRAGHWPGFHGRMGGSFHGGGFFAGPGGVVHGQVVVRESGKFRTEDIQTGQVTAVSGSSLTVRSADGYTKSYRVTSATQVDAGKTGIGSVKVGNQVVVTATVSGSTASLTRTLDLSLLGHGMPAPRWSQSPSASG